MTRKAIFDAVKAARGRGFVANDPDIGVLDTALDKVGVPRDGTPVPKVPLYFIAPTERILVEIIEHEAIVLEYYKDSVGVGTWGFGVTDKSGHFVSRYKDKPQSVRRCLEVYEWLLRTKYLPDVLEAFKGRPLQEHELGAALSFHWNTGGILKASWVRDVLAGRIEEAKVAFLNWSTPKEIIGRRKCERDLFFEGKWTSDGHVTIYDVTKPSYKPDWKSARQIDIRPELQRVMAAVAAEGRAA